YLTQLASMASANGAAPEQGGQYQTITGKIAAIGWDVTGGQKYWYITLAGQPGHVYVGTVASVGPALVLAQTGDRVTISVLNVGAQESTQTMQSFTDAGIPLNAPGSYHDEAGARRIRPVVVVEPVPCPLPRLKRLARAAILASERARTARLTVRTWQDG